MYTMDIFDVPACINELIVSFLSFIQCFCITDIFLLIFNLGKFSLNYAHFLLLKNNAVLDRKLILLMFENSLCDQY